MPASIPSSSILLVQPFLALRELINRYFSGPLAYVCFSFEDALTYMPLHDYQVVICPQSIASLDEYSLHRLNQHYHPCSPFIVTTEPQEVADVRQAIEQGALGFVHGTTTSSSIILIIQGLVALYRLRFSLARRMKWATTYRDMLRRSPMREKSEMLCGARKNSRVMREQTLTAIEGSLQVFQAQANTLVSEARRRMWDH